MTEKTPRDNEPNKESDDTGTWLDSAAAVALGFGAVEAVALGNSEAGIAGIAAGAGLFGANKVREARNRRHDNDKPEQQ